jgi:hypothetical protein
MIDILDFNSGDDQSLFHLLKESNHVRDLILITQIQKDLEVMSETVLPLTVASFRVLNDAACMGLTPEHLDVAFEVVASPKAILARMKRLISFYRSLLATTERENADIGSSEMAHAYIVFAGPLSVGVGSLTTRADTASAPHRAKVTRADLRNYVSFPSFHDMHVIT